MGSVEEDQDGLTTETQRALADFGPLVVAIARLAQPYLAQLSRNFASTKLHGLGAQGFSAKTTLGKLEGTVGVYKMSNDPGVFYAAVDVSFTPQTRVLALDSVSEFIGLLVMGFRGYKIESVFVRPYDPDSQITVHIGF